MDASCFCFSSSECFLAASGRVKGLAAHLTLDRWLSAFLFAALPEHRSETSLHCQQYAVASQQQVLHQDVFSRQSVFF